MLTKELFGACILNQFCQIIFILKVKVAQSCPILHNPMDLVPGILHARILEWVALPLWGYSQPRDRTQVSHMAGGFFTSWATGEAQFFFERSLIITSNIDHTILCLNSTRNPRFTLKFKKYLSRYYVLFNYIGYKNL